MKDVFNAYLEAGNELDELSLEGFYGEDIKRLVENRETQDRNEHLYDSLKLWIDDKNQYGKENVKEYILTFFNLYLDAYKVAGQEAVDVLTAFWQGTIDNPELEFFSSYTEFSRLFTETKQLLNELHTNKKLSHKKRVIASLIGSYSKGVEFSGKVLTTCIVLEKIAKGETYNYYKISNLTIFEKVDLFTSSNNPDYQNLVNLIKRNVRNSEAHLSYTYDYNKNIYLLKKRDQGKLKHEKISFETMLTQYFLGIGAFTQGFVYSGVLFVLGHEDKEKFKSSVMEIYG